MSPIIIQSIGFFGLIALVLSYQQKNRTRILGLMLIGQVAFTLHFIMLGALTAVGMNIVGMIRSMVFLLSDKKKWASWRYWPIVFIVLFLVAGLMAKESWLGVLPVVAMVIETSGLWLKNLKRLRMISLFPHPFWVVYNMIKGSWAGVITEVFVFSSILIAIVRYDILKRSE